jgi:hypothetical protein
VVGVDDRIRRDGDRPKSLVHALNLDQQVPSFVKQIVGFLLPRLVGWRIDDARRTRRHHGTPNVGSSPP